MHNQQGSRVLWDWAVYMHTLCALSIGNLMNKKVDLLLCLPHEIRVRYKTMHLETCNSNISHV